jgi:TonB family protein
LTAQSGPASNAIQVPDETRAEIVQAVYPSSPVLILPAQTLAAAENTWAVECVVQPSGTCTNTRVVRSLDPTFGLDQEALEAAQLFRFRPGMRMGEPVPVLVTIELSFSLH